jgi:hypothetical protein
LWFFRYDNTRIQHYARVHAIAAAVVIGVHAGALIYLLALHEPDFSLDRSGHADLDNEVMAMIMRAEPPPPFPESMPKARIDLTVPIRFSPRSARSVSVAADDVSELSGCSAADCYIGATIQPILARQ